MEDYDEPTTSELLQSEIDIPEIAVIPVTVIDPVRVDELPTEVTYRNIIVESGGHAQKILNADPRRKRIVIWTGIDLGTGADFICIGSTSGQVENFAGALLAGVANTSGVSRYEFSDKGEIWARSGQITVVNTDEWGGYAASSSDMILSMIIEHWAR